MRKVLGQTPDGEGYITTIPRRGYRFAAKVREVRKEEDQAGGAAYAAVRIGEDGAKGIGSWAENRGVGAKAIDDLASGEFAGYSPTDGAAVPAVEPETSVNREALVPEPAHASGRTGWNGYYKTAAVISLIVLLSAVAGMALYRFIRHNGFEAGSGEPSREMTIKALTTTGNITCAAISPDGKYIVYGMIERSQLSSLWVMQLATSISRPIVPPAKAEYTALSFSPDGDYIYFVRRDGNTSTRTLYRVPQLGGPAKKLVENASTAGSFSPDGKQFVFRRELNDRRQSALFVADADGTGEKEIAAVKYPEGFRDPAWSPDGGVIACAVGRDGGLNTYVVKVDTGDWRIETLSAQRWRWVGQMGWLADSSGLLMVASHNPAMPFQIWHLSYPGGEARRITTDSNFYNRLSVSANSRTLVALQRRQVTSMWVVPAEDVGRARQITFGTGGYRGSVSWTPDGQIVYDSEAGDASAVSIMNADGSSPRQLIGEMAGSAYVGNATVSPDGRYILYASDLAGTRHIWRMNIDGSNPVRLTNGDNAEDRPHCSPNGRWVVYTRITSDRPTLWKVSVDGGEPVQLTRAYADSPAISPDGKLIACLYSDAEPPAELKLAVLPFEGGEPVKIFPHSVQSSSPVRWTPDGRGLTYWVNSIGASEIWIQPLEGEKPVRLIGFETDRIFGFDWSPDGKHLACVRGFWSMDAVLIRDFK